MCFPAYTRPVTVSAVDFYEIGLTLPAEVRRRVALLLLDSVEDEASVQDAWTEAIGSRVDEILSGQVEMIPGEQVFAKMAERRAVRQAARTAHEA